MARKYCFCLLWRFSEGLIVRLGLYRVRALRHTLKMKLVHFLVIHRFGLLFWGFLAALYATAAIELTRTSMHKGAPGLTKAFRPRRATCPCTPGSPYPKRKQKGGEPR